MEIRHANNATLIVVGNDRNALRPAAAGTYYIIFRTPKPTFLKHLIVIYVFLVVVIRPYYT
jgi:hypothetical protein